MKKLKVAIIGYGGIARVHNVAYHKLVEGGYPIELVAVCERDLSRVTATLDFNLGSTTLPLPEGCRLYSDVDELIEKEEFHIADICLPTFLHKSMAIKLMEAGKHVMCEKPMALSSSDCDEMLSVAEKNGVKLMVAHCLRFDSPYIFLKECIDKGDFGKLDNIYLDRHSIYPTWGAGKVFDDNKKTGGCALDTHIHDIDVTRYLLGDPKAVSAVEFNKPPMYQAVTTTLYYDGVTAVVNGSWDSAYDFTFRCGYRARFERASVVYEDFKVKVIPVLGEAYYPELVELDCTAEEISCFADWINAPEGASCKCPPEGSAESVRLVERLRESAALGGEKIKLS